MKREDNDKILDLAQRIKSLTEKYKLACGPYDSYFIGPIEDAIFNNTADLCKMLHKHKNYEYKSYSYNTGAIDIKIYDQRIKDDSYVMVEFDKSCVKYLRTANNMTVNQEKGCIHIIFDVPITRPIKISHLYIYNESDLESTTVGDD